MVASPLPPPPENSKDVLPATKDDLNSTKQQQQHQKLDYLEGLRGLSALHVVIAHQGGSWGRFSWVLLYGQDWTFAVPCFFMLSGAVITKPVLANNDLRRLMSSFIRRFFRLLLPLWGFMLVWTIWYAIFPDEKNAPGQASIMDFLYAITFLLMWTSWTRGIPGVGWTLPQEIVGSNLVYLVTAIMLPMKRNPIAKYIMLTVMIIFNWLGENWMNYFLAGLMLADMRENGYLERFRQWKYSHAVKFALVITTAPFAFTYGGNPIRKWFEYVVSDVIWLNKGVLIPRQMWFPNATVIFPWIFACMFIIETTPWLQKVLSWKPFLFLGKVSYMLYLSHQAIIIIVAEPFNAFLNSPTIPRWVTFPLSIVLLIGGDLIIAWILTYLFDTPALNFIKFWEGVFLAEEQWSWALVLDWSQRKYRRTIDDFKCTALKIREASNPKNWRRPKSLKRRADSVDPIPHADSEMTIDEVVEVVEEVEQEASRSLSTAGTTKTVYDKTEGEGKRH
ncbi:hypothetical protein HDV05_004879 [Chytridiales sp. JEL 0842]|nr:hypothetical protein HDV05_004879 [Chytridiales sp. JEL 0842]